jgi:hypothetical protein
MKLNKSEAKALYWSKVPAEERSQKAREMAKTKHANLTPQERSEHAKKMIRARIDRRKAIQEEIDSSY